MKDKFKIKRFVFQIFFVEGEVCINYLIVNLVKMRQRFISSSKNSFINHHCHQQLIISEFRRKQAIFARKALIKTKSTFVTKINVPTSFSDLPSLLCHDDNRLNTQISHSIETAIIRTFAIDNFLRKQSVCGSFGNSPQNE